MLESAGIKKLTEQAERQKGDGFSAGNNAGRE
jgi:hypothetical protein